MKITLQTSRLKIHQLENLAKAYERNSYAIEFGCNNANERAALENQRHQLEAKKDRLLQPPDWFSLPRPPPLRSTASFAMYHLFSKQITFSHLMNRKKGVQHDY